MSTTYEQYEKKYGGLKQNIKLPTNPLGGYTDSIYAAQNALLRHQITQQYADILQQLGYTDPSGRFVMGDVESNANRQRSDLDRSRLLSIESTTNDMRNAGTMFSGYRGTAQARAEHPFVQGIADLDVAVPKQLAHLFEQASGLITDYSLQDQSLLADAAARQAGMITQSPVWSPSTAGGDTGVTPPATPPISYGLDPQQPTAMPSTGVLGPTPTPGLGTVPKKPPVLGSGLQKPGGQY